MLIALCKNLAEEFCCEFPQAHPVPKRWYLALTIDNMIFPIRIYQASVVVTGTTQWFFTSETDR